MREEAIEFLARSTADWIATQRDRYRPIATPVDPLLREALATHFTDSTLDRARIARVPEIENPDFYETLDEVPLDLRGSAGITFGDTILVSDLHVRGPLPPALIFHELVHVVQYSILGVTEFARRYVSGWAANGFEYLRIPLEVQAHDLERRFLTDELGGVLVEEWVVAGWIEQSPPA